jgi:NADPH:quinone reductase-like Zn-dependent oxidoreductase
VIAGVRKSQLAEAKGLNADQVVALDDDAAFDALAPVDVVANTVRGTTSALLLDKVKHGGTYASVTGVPDSARSLARFAPWRLTRSRTRKRSCTWLKR